MTDGSLGRVRGPRKTGVDGPPVRRFRKQNFRDGPLRDPDSATPDSATPDFNALRMSEFKQNPGYYIQETKGVPLLISRYGRAQAVVLSLDAYNLLLERIRLLKADLLDVTAVLDAVSPKLREFLSDTPKSWTVDELLPKWPLIHVAPPRRKGRNGAPMRAESDLQLLRDSAAAFMEVMAGNYRLPEPDSDDDWGRFAVRRDVGEDPERVPYGEDPERVPYGDDPDLEPMTFPEDERYY